MPGLDKLFCKLFFLFISQLQFLPFLREDRGGNMLGYGTGASDKTSIEVSG